MLNGSFFTDVDQQQEDDYWSGYFTSRVFQQNQDRILETLCYTAEITIALALSTTSEDSKVADYGFSEIPALRYAQQNLALFQQHHHHGHIGFFFLVCVVALFICALCCVRAQKREKLKKI